MAVSCYLHSTGSPECMAIPLAVFAVEGGAINSGDPVYPVKGAQYHTVTNAKSYLCCPSIQGFVA